MNIDQIVSSDTLRLVLRRWHIFASLIAVSLILAIVTYTLLPRRYLVTATVIGTRYESDVTPNAHSAGFSAAALLGVTPNDLPTITDFGLYMHLMLSPELGASILNDPVMHRVFRKYWHNDHWEAPDTLYQNTVNAVFGLMGRKGWTPPDGFTVSGYLERNLSIVPAKDAKLLTIGIWTSDPKLGADIISLLNSRADTFVREMAQKRFQAKVDFLQKAISTASVQEARTVLGTALARAETDKIFSFSDLPFAAEFLTLPNYPSRPQSPNFRIVCGIFVACGALIFFLDVLLIQQTGTSIFSWNLGRVKGTQVSAETTHAASKPYA